MKVTRVWADEWEGIYADGFIVDQNHSVSLEDILRKLADMGCFDFADREYDESKEPLDDILPDKLEDCKLKNAR